MTRSLSVQAVVACAETPERRRIPPSKGRKTGRIQRAPGRLDTLDDVANAWRVERLALASDHPHRLAYNQAVLHANTPTAAYLDPLGRPFLSVAHNKVGDTDEFIATRTVLDIEACPRR